MSNIDRMKWDSSYERATSEPVTGKDGRTYRAVMIFDDWREAPEFDFGCPVYRVTDRRLEKTSHGSESDAHSGVDLVAAYDQTGGDLGLINRWLRVFHGGGLRVIRSTIYRDGDDFVVYDTRAMREYWGQTGEMLETSDPSAPEWQAYLDGEVYAVGVEVLGDVAEDRRKELTEALKRALGLDSEATAALVEAVMNLDDETQPEWLTFGEMVTGHYGKEWAAEAAFEMLDHYI